MTLLTPLYINFTNIVEPSITATDPLITPRPSLPTDATDPNYPALLQEYNEFTRPDIILSPRYYLILKPPGNLRSGSGLQPLKFDIPLQGPFAGQLKLKLYPSFGYGVNSCYTAEYWRWYPYIPGFTKGVENAKARRITTEFIRKEHWLIPEIDNRTGALRHVYSLPHRRQVVSSLLLKTKRTYSNPATIEGDPTYNYIQDEVSPEYYSLFAFTNTSKASLIETYNIQDPLKPYDKYVTAAYLQYKTEAPLPNVLPVRGGSIDVEYTVNYLAPISVREVLFMDYEEEGHYLRAKEWYRELPRILYDVYF